MISQPLQLLSARTHLVCTVKIVRNYYPCGCYWLVRLVAFRNVLEITVWLLIIL